MRPSQIPKGPTFLFNFSRRRGRGAWLTGRLHDGGIRSVRSPPRRAPLLATPIATPLQGGRPENPKGPAFCFLNYGRSSSYQPREWGGSARVRWSSFKGTAPASVGSANKHGGVPGRSRPCLDHRDRPLAHVHPGLRAPLRPKQAHGDTGGILAPQLAIFSRERPRFPSELPITWSIDFRCSLVPSIWRSIISPQVHFMSHHSFAGFGFVSAFHERHRQQK